MLNYSSEYLVGFREKYGHLLPQSQNVEILTPVMPNIENSDSSNHEDVDEIDEIMNDSQEDEELI